MRGTQCTKPTIDFWNLMRDGMEFYLKTLVSKFEPCVVCLRVQSFMTVLVWFYMLYLDGVVRGRC